MDLLTTLKIIAALIAGLWGGLPMFVSLLLVLMTIDVVTGLLAGYVARSLSSDVSWRGLAKKAQILIYVGAVAAIQQLVPQLQSLQIPIPGYDLSLSLASALAGFYCLHEFLSITENSARSGLPIPRFLRDALVKIEQVSTEAGLDPVTPSPPSQSPTS